MARTNKIDLARNKFQRDKASSMQLVEDMRAILSKKGVSVLKSKDQARIEQITEVAFLKLVISWEVLVERTLVLYLMGEEAGNGRRPDILVGQVDDEARAYKLLSGNLDFNIEKKHLHYLLNSEEIIKVANFFFGNHFYMTIGEQSNSDLIRYARYIRNHIAHNSASSRAYFKGTTDYFMGEGYKGTVGRFLMEPVEKGFGDGINQSGWTHFEAYCAFFVSLAIKIAPEKGK